MQRRLLLVALACWAFTALAADGEVPEVRDGGAAPSAPVCPARREDVKAGTFCRPTTSESCTFDGGAWCACEETACFTPAGPVPGCTPAFRWRCRHDGCPHTPAGACSTPGKQCVYDDGMCASVATCERGRWQSGSANCRPAAPTGLPPQIPRP